MKTLNLIFAASLLAVLLAGATFAQQQGAQTLNTTTLSNAITSTSSTRVTLGSVSNVTATASAQTVLWVDTEAMTVVTNGPTSGNTVTVTRGTNGTKAETHASGRTVYVGRPNLFQGYDVAGTCTAGNQSLPWINLSDGYRFECYSDGIWFHSGTGSAGSAAVTAVTGFCTTTFTSGAGAFLNGTACASSSTATYRYTVATAGELANLRVFSSASETAAAGDAIVVNKNGSATTITCTIVQNAAVCSDTTHAVAVVPGDTITFAVTAATSAAAANMSASVGLYGQ